MTDPRYDPRFQRGWDGTPPDSAPAPPSSTPPPTHPAPVAPAGRAEPPRVAVPDPIGAAPTGPAEEPGTEAEVEPAAGPVRNPYRIALVMLGAVLVLAGAGMLWQLAQPITSASPTEYVIPQLEGMVAPWIALSGLLAIIAAIALGAFRRA